MLVPLDGAGDEPLFHHRTHVFLHLARNLRNNGIVMTIFFFPRTPDAIERSCGGECEIADR
jgi:hypothetical protein